MESPELLIAELRARPWSGRAERRRLTLGSGLLAAFLLLAVSTIVHAFDTFDASVDGRFHMLALSSAALVTAMSVFADIGGPSNALGVGLIVAVFFHLYGDRRRAVFCAAASVGAFGLAAGLKFLIERRRPVWRVPVAHASGSSFPSGHCAACAALTTILVIAVLPLFAAGLWRRAVTLLIAAYAVAVPLSRLVLGVHYPTDVLGGVLLGCGWTFLCAGLVLRVAPPRAAGCHRRTR